MNTKLKAFLLSLLVPGLGYLQSDDKKLFYRTMLLYFGVFGGGVMSRLFVTHDGFMAIMISWPVISILTGIHAATRLKTTSSNGLLKLAFTVLFLLITGFSFANRSTVMGFDIMQMGVPVMQPAVPQGVRFLVDTWAYNNKLPERGDIVAHTFDGQQGIYLNRIIAVGKDRISIKEGVVYLNGQLLEEVYVLKENVTRKESKDMEEISVPEGHYFVMGDNRDKSFGDSRFSGVITIRNIQGKKTDLLQ